MEEQELVKNVDDILEPLKNEHLKFMEAVIDTVQKAFLEGIEVGNKTNNHE